MRGTLYMYMWYTRIQYIQVHYTLLMIVLLLYSVSLMCHHVIPAYYPSILPYCMGSEALLYYYISLVYSIIVFAKSNGATPTPFSMSSNKIIFSSSVFTVGLRFARLPFIAAHQQTEVVPCRHFIVQCAVHCFF